MTEIDDLASELILRGWTTWFAGDRVAPDAIIAVGYDQHWADVVILRGHDQAAAYRTLLRPSGDDPLKPPGIVWHYLSGAKQTLRSVLAIPPHAVAEVPYLVPSECRVPELDARPLTMLPGRPRAEALCSPSRAIAERRDDITQREMRRQVTGDERAQLRQQLADRYAEGASIRALAASTGWSYGTVHGLLTEAGATLRQRGGNNRALITGDVRVQLRHQLAERYKDGASIRKLAASIGRARTTVRRLLTEADVTLRANGSPHRRTKP